MTWEENMINEFSKKWFMSKQILGLLFQGNF